MDKQHPTITSPKLPIFSARGTNNKTILSRYGTSPENEEIMKNIFHCGTATTPPDEFYIPTKKIHHRSIQHERTKFMKKYFSSELEFISKKLEEGVATMREEMIECSFVVTDHMLDLDKVEGTITSYFTFLGYTTTSSRKGMNITLTIL